MPNPNDHPALYLVRVYDHAGVFRHDRILDGPGGAQAPLQLTDGPVLEVRPGGDCRQGSFSGVGQDLDIHYEDIVEVWWSEDGGESWNPRWAGYADTVPNSRDLDPGPVTLLGLRQRLDRVEARTTIAQDSPNRQWAQLINDTLATGQLGGAIQPAPVPAAGVGAVRPAIVPRYESVMMIADKWLTADLEDASAGIGDYGVNARREPIWGKPGGLHVLDEAAGAIIQGKAGSSAKLRTHIRATWNKPGPGPYLFFGESILQEQEGAQTTLLVQVADPDLYGYSSRRELLQPLPKFFTRSAVTNVTAEWTPGTGYATQSASGDLVTRGGAGYQPATVTGDPAALNDQDPDTVVNVAAPADTQGGTFRVQVRYPPGPVPWGVAVHVVGGIVTGFLFDGVLDVRCPPDPNGLLLFPDEVRAWITARWDAGVNSHVAVRIARTGTSDVQLSTFGALFIDEAEVKAAVQRLAHLPTPDPETIRVPGWNHDPVGFVTAIYRHPDGTEAGRTESRRADLYRYVVDDDGQQWTEIQVGQADDAEDVQYAAQVERLARTTATQAALNTT